MTEKIKKNWVLIVILLVVTVLRLWRLGSIPPHLTPDEASLGYNAYSILKTGRDEYGKVLPLIFKSFGDYKPGLYIYLTVPFVASFGLNELSVRFPSALAGIISVYLIYLIVKKLFSEKVALCAAFVAAVCPWLIYFSRGAWEVNVSLTLTLAGIYYFLRSFEKNKYFVLCILSFVLTLLTYQGAKLATGIVIVILLLIYWRDFWRIKKKYLVLGLVLGLIISLPIIISLFTGKAGRLNIFSVFSYRRPTEVLQTFLDQGKEKIDGLSYYLFHSETLNFKRGILGRYFNHFSGRFLFFEGDWGNPRHSAPYQGMLLLSDILLLMVGFVSFLKSKILDHRSVKFVWFWLILASLPAVLSRDQVHAVRAMNMVIPLIMIISLGLSRIFENKKLLVMVFSFYFLALSYFLDAYFVHVPKHNSLYWEYGYKQIVEAVTPIQGNYQTIKVQQSFAQPYIYFLFFQKYDPAKYQKQASWVESEYKGDVGYVTKLDKIEFSPIDWSVNRGEKGTLFVADPIRIPPDDSKDESLFKVIKEIKYLNGRDTAFRIVEVR